MSYIDKFGGRKFILSVLIVLVCFTLVLASRLDVGVFVKVLLGISALYTGANTALQFKKPAVDKETSIKIKPMGESPKE